jgi:hypothetical protein
VKDWHMDIGSISHPRLQLFSLGLIFGGFVFISVFAATPLWEAFDLQQNPTCDNRMLICPQNEIFTYTKQQGREISDMFRGTAILSSKGIFAVNHPITYDVTVTANNTTVIKEMYFSFITANESDFERIPNFSINNFFKSLQFQSRLIKIPSDIEGVFHIKNDDWKISTQSDIKLIFFVINEYGDINIIHKSDIKFTVASQELKVQDVTNQESRVGNKTMLGLTWLGIGLLPIFLGVDLLARARLDE